MRKRTFRTYGKVLNIWTHIEEINRCGEVREVERTVQTEIEYKEWDSETFELVGAGSEDFSADRFRKEMMNKFVYAWNGKRNAGGHRWFECVGTVNYKRGDAAYVKAMYRDRHNAYDIELR